MGPARRSSSTPPKPPRQPKATRAPKPAPAVPTPGAAHYRVLLPVYWGKAHGPAVLNEFAARVRSDLSGEEIRDELIPYLPASSLGTTGVQISRLRAALERVSKS